MKGGALRFCLGQSWFSGINLLTPASWREEYQHNTKLIEDPVRNNEILSRIPAGRWGTPEDVKGVTVFLATHASDYINGAIIPVDGGYLSK